MKQSRPRQMTLGPRLVVDGSYAAKSSKLAENALTICRATRVLLLPAAREEANRYVPEPVRIVRSRRFLLEPLCPIDR
jgi:hypothetical protein